MPRRTASWRRKTISAGHSPLPVLALRVTAAVLDRLERAYGGEAVAELGALAELPGAGKE